MLHSDCAKSTFIFRLVQRNLIVLAHNALIIPVVFVLFSVPLSWKMLWFIPGFLLVAGNVFWIAFCLAIICARYRDVPQIISSAMQLVFFVTPIMYMPEQLSDRIQVIEWNPFANLLQLMTSPLLGEQPTLWHYQYCLVLFLVGVIFSLWFVAKYSKRVVYWL